MAVGHQVVLAGLVGLLAILADPAAQALRQNEQQGRGEQEGLDPHVDQPGHGGRAVVGVEGGEHQVAGEGGPDGDLGRLQVARLADEDHVGVLPQEGAEDPGERPPDVFADLDLVDALQVVLDRILGGHDVVLG